MNIAPQPGFQERVLSCPADILFCGGGSGHGKSYVLLLEAIRNTGVKGFAAIIYRRTFSQIESPNGLWDTSMEIFPYAGGKPIKSSLTWDFGVSKVAFKHMQHSDDWENIQGTSIPFFGFDELCQFERNQFFKVLAWNRSKCGVKPYTRATMNPDPDSFVAEFIDWYLDEDGFIANEKDGVLRYFTVINDNPVWGDSKEEVYELAKHVLDKSSAKNKFDLIKSFTFIKGDLKDNKILMDTNPEYEGNLLAMSEQDQLRYLHGNWKVKLGDDIIINYDKFQDIFTNTFVKGHIKYITADIATEGKDCMVIWVWEGKKVIDLILMEKNSGKEALYMLDAKKNEYMVSNSCISFDAGGVGGGLTGWFDKAIEFKGIKRPVGTDLYSNLKSQVAYEFSYCINREKQKTNADAYYIPPDIAERKYPFNTPALYRGRTIKWILNHQIRAYRRAKPDNTDRKVGLIDNSEMKALLQGISPDFLVSLSQREIFNIGFKTIKVTRR